MRFRLLQARNPDDPVRAEERLAFASKLGVSPDRVVPFDLTAELSASDDDLRRAIDGVDAVLVGGSGAYSAFGPQPWGAAFIDLMGGLARAGFPTFASCFGFQALVMALGGEVRTDPDGAEVGSFDLDATDAARRDPLFGSLPARFVAQEGHKDRATTLPAGVTLLATSPRCPFQALRVDGKPVWATQFHPELSSDENRARFQRYQALYAKAFGDTEASSLLDQFRPSPEANALLSRFAEIIRNA